MSRGLVRVIPYIKDGAIEYEHLSIIYSGTILADVLQPEQLRTIASQKYSVFGTIFMKSSIQTKSAVTLTFPSVLLLSGLWALWHTPTTAYEPRKNEQIAGLDLVAKPNDSYTHTFKVKENVEELTVNAWPQIITTLLTTRRKRHRK